jgi:hypothetical protein
MKSIFEVLKEIETRPAMFLGNRIENHHRWLFHLDLLIHGYEWALVQHKIMDWPERFSVKFMDFLHDKHGWCRSSGALGSISMNTANSDEAWESFWQLVWSFQAHLNSNSEVSIAKEGDSNA